MEPFAVLISFLGVVQFAVYVVLVVFAIAMAKRAVVAMERIAGAQERRAEVAERTGRP
jgi:hypothetical protein